MRHIRILLLALLISAGSLYVAPATAQISVKAIPYSFQAPVAADLPTYTLAPVRLETKTAPAYEQDERGFIIVPPATPGIEISVDLGFEQAGLWQTLPDGGRLWRLRIASEGADALHLVYDDFWMPPGAQLFLYNDDRSVVRGAFTEQNNKQHGGFATDFVPGEATTLEYYEPPGVAAPGRLHVATVLHGIEAGRGFETAGGPYVPTSLSCSINTACPAGSGWEDEINATVRIASVGCTGVLLNNTREDGKAYVLTANHCGAPSVGQTVNWVFEFNYQSATCADPAQTPVPQTLSGAVVRAAEGGSADYTLLELLEPIPASYNAHFAGWSIENVPPTNGVVIGHPKGDIKKITVDDHPITDDWNSPNHWLAQFDHGTIETGSSGSPLFNENHEFVGHVRSVRWFDPNACTGPGGDDNDPLIVFPKLAYIWDLGTEGNRVSDYLDPDGTGSTSVPPLEPPSPIWINEINADGSGSPETDEFIEIVGPPGTSLTNYQIEVYACIGGATTLQSTQTIGTFTLANDYEEFGIFLIAGPSSDVPNVDQLFGGLGTDVLPDGSGQLVLKDNTGKAIFDYQYDTESGGVPDNCPSVKTTRSIGDAPGNGTMGFTLNARPAPTDLASAGLTATPGEQNWDGGQQLPVELVAFDALLDGGAVLLRWETASETNNAGFEVQRYSEGGEGAWQVLGWVDGHGTTLEAQRYDYRIDALPAGAHRFRLKQIDYDGTFAYSPEVEVAVGLPTAYRLSPAYPNPFNPETAFSLSVARAQRVEVAVYDLMGRRVALLHDGLLEAQSTRAFTFEAATLPSGLYLIRAVGERFVASETVTLVK